MNEVKHFTCPHCGEQGAGIDKDVSCRSRVAVTGLNWMELCLQTDDDNLDIYEVFTTYYCCGCGEELATDSQALWDMLCALPDSDGED